MRFLRSLTFIVLFFTLCISFVSAQDDKLPQLDPNPTPPQQGLTAQSAILIEASTGRVIFEKDADSRQYPASMTKMMTAILSLEKTKPDDVVYIPDDAVDTEGSSLGLNKGDAMRMDELCSGMMLASGNDAAAAIASAVSGSTNEFVNLMNNKAAEIGATDTHFVNPSGLPDKDHYSTARDMAKIAAYGYQNEAFRKIVSHKAAEVSWLIPDKKRIVDNTNELLGDYPYADGIKTGYTNDAGGCLAASATRDGITLIAVVMHSDNENLRFVEAKKLLDDGFQAIHFQRAYKKGDLRRSVHVHSGETPTINVSPQADIIYPVISGENKREYSVKMNIPHYVEAPVKTGDTIGSVEILYKNKKVGEVPVSAERASSKGFNFKSICYVVYDSIADFFTA